MKQTLCSVTSNVEVMPGIHLMWIEAPDIAATAQPGQFITVQCENFTLRRPFSVHQVSSREITLLFKVAGKGTLWLSQRQTDERIDILGPLGKGFTIEPKSKRLLLVAGGIGIAPLVFLMQPFLLLARGKTNSRIYQKEFNLFLSPRMAPWARKAWPWVFCLIS